MRLLTWNHHDDLILTQVPPGQQAPPYSILSHTWGTECEEVSFTDLQQGRAADKAGYRKLQFCHKQAVQDGIKHFWVDTCCIDKSNSAELSEAINSMYRWYRGAKKCYVYLTDVSTDRSGYNGQESTTQHSSLRTSRWFKRGWTLQELIAPKEVEFYSNDGICLGTKHTLAEQIQEIAGLPLAALWATAPTQFSIAERWQWTQGRKTTRPEDMAYCLLGIFDVHMPLIYGEGDHAWLRLEKAVNERSEASISDFTNDNLMPRSLASHSRPTLTQNLYVDNGQKDRPLKRRRLSPTEEDNILGRGSTGQEVGNDGKRNYDSLIKSLLFDRIDFRVNNVKKALLSTCQWLFSHADFKAWYESGGADKATGFLWIKGKPGCGKSTLMKAAVDWVCRQRGKKRSRETVIPYFFNARASASLEKSSLGLYRTLVYRLLSSSPALSTLFADIFALKDPGPSGEHWTVEELQGFLHDAVESNVAFKLCLFIDALDEAEYEDDVRQMISFLAELSDRVMAVGSPCRLQICLSSRHYPHIRVGRGLSLIVEDQLEHGEDVNIYITKQLTCLEGPEKDDIRVEISKKSAHIFLWVVLVVEILNKLDDCGTPLSVMRAHLNTIPAGLNELFKEILIKSVHGIETSILFFQWMVFCMRPIEPAELFVAMEYSRSPHDLTWALSAELSIPPPDRLTNFILNCSRGLVEVIETDSSQAPVVQFIHETVREFLLKEHGLASIVPALAANLAGISHEILRIACARCISTIQMPLEYVPYCETGHKNNASLDTFRSGMRLALPFLDYAISHLFDHAEQAQENNMCQKVFLQHQIDEKGLWLDPYRGWWNVLERYKSKKVTPDITLNYFLAERRYLNLLPVILDVSDTINTICGRHGSVLHMASYHGVQEIVQMLVDRDADVNIQGGRDGSAFNVALRQGHDMVAKLLLDAGADVDASEKHGNTLYAASADGKEKLVQMLLDHGVNVNANTTGTACVNALQAASWYGHEKIVRILLDHGADINAIGGQYGSALKAASALGHVKIVQMLLDHGANVNANTTGRACANALQAASWYGHEKTVRTLLDHGADINAIGGQYGSALKAASALGHVKIVQMLLDHGANVDANADGRFDGNALYVVAEKGDTQVVQMLLNHGANVNAQGGLYGNALQVASIKGQERTVQILLDHGADVNAQGGLYGNALQAASALGQERTVQILLDHGADVNAQGGKYGNALQAASSQSESIVQILLDHGANVNAQGGKYGSALQAASVLGQERTVQILLDHGADVNAQGGKYGNALQAASTQGHKRIVQILRKAGAK